MESSLAQKNLKKDRRSLRVRKKLRGTSVKPRLCVVKTNKHIYVQLIDDEGRCTLAAVSTMSKSLKNTPQAKKNKDTAKYLGEKIAELGKTLSLEDVVFDRGPFKYHGIIAMVAEGARQGGLQF